jgi:RNAse (barnase) inhibitor barstar
MSDNVIASSPIDNQGAPASNAGSAAPSSTPAQPSQWFLAEGVPGAGDKPDYFIDSKYKTLADQAKAYRAKQAEFDAKLKGFAGAPDNYEIKLSDDLKDIKLNTEDPLYKEFSDFAKQNNMTQESFNNVVNLFLKHSASEFQADADKMAQAQAEEIKKLGKDAEHLPQLEQWGKNNLPAELFDTFRGIVNSANTAKLFLHLMNNSSYAKLPNVNGAAADGLNAMKLREMMADPKYKIDMQYRKDIDAKYKAFYG